MISLELDKSNDDAIDCATLYMDKNGLEYFKKVIDFFQTDKTDHVDLFSESWGGTGEFCSLLQDNENRPIQYLKIMFLKNEHLKK
jgi:hypothetical protein